MVTEAILPVRRKTQEPQAMPEKKITNTYPVLWGRNTPKNKQKNHKG